MAAVEIASPAPLVFTDAAANKVRQLIQEEDNQDLKLRVFVSGGGCSGFQYGFTFDENLQDGDTSVENGGITLLVDPMSFQYLMGAEIDYTGGAGRCPVRDSQSQRTDNLRLRLLVFPRLSSAHLTVC